MNTVLEIHEQLANLKFADAELNLLSVGDVLNCHNDNSVFEHKNAKTIMSKIRESKNGVLFCCRGKVTIFETIRIYETIMRILEDLDYCFGIKCVSPVDISEDKILVNKHSYSVIIISPDTESG